MNSRLLLLFTRYPMPGQVKTRLWPALGAAGAARLQRRLTEHILEIARSFIRSRGIDFTVYFDGCQVQQMARMFGRGHPYRPQSGGELGERLHSAFAAAFTQGQHRVVLIGADCPGITGRILGAAFAALEDHDLVLGPAHDGGYYLIGLRALHSALFREIPWGKAAVLAKTLEQAEGLNLRTALLEPLSDIDRPEDLPVWENLEKQGVLAGVQPLSVIIPALNEAGHIGRTLASLHTRQGVEIIVADGGSTDGTAEAARAAGAAVLTSPRGRANQQNSGAAAATGTILFFLHADSLAPPGYPGLIRRALAVPGVVAGAFSLAISGSHRGLTIISRLANLRSRWLQLPYGDQGLFLPASLFFRLGGFPRQPLMEDFALVRQLRHHGRVLTLPQTVLTSGRRWHQLGLWRTTAINQLMILGYYLGVAPETLARLYRERWKPPPR